MFLLFLTNENTSPDHVEGEKRHTNKRGPRSLDLANVLPSASIMERDNEWATERAWAAALGLSCLCSLTTNSALPVFLQEHRTRDLTQSPGQHEKRRKRRGGLQMWAIWRACDKHFLADSGHWLKRGERRQCVLIIAGGSPFLENRLWRRLVLTHAAQRYWCPTGHREASHVLEFWSG